MTIEQFTNHVSLSDEIEALSAALMGMDKFKNEYCYRYVEDGKISSSMELLINSMNIVWQSICLLDEECRQNLRENKI